MTRYYIKARRPYPAFMDDVTKNHVLSFFERSGFAGEVVFGSGESLSAPGFLDFLKDLLDLGIRPTVLSNGVLFDETLPSWCFDGGVRWGITLDGMTQDVISGFQAGVDVGRVINNLFKVSDLWGSDSFYLNYTLTSANIGELDSFAELAIATKCKSVYVTPLKVYNHPTFESLREYAILDCTQTKVALESFKTKLASSGIHPVVPAGKPKGKQYCWRTRGVSPLIDIDGEVSFCSGREERVFGDVDSLGEQDWGAFEKELESSLQMRSEWCSSCHGHADSLGLYGIPLGRTVLYGC